MLSNLSVVNVCLGSDPQVFRFNPSHVHDMYAIQNILIIELIVDDTFLVSYEFIYLDTDDLIRDFRAVNNTLLDLTK